MAYLLSGRTMESEKQPLLTNGSEATIISRPRIGKRVPMATDKYATIEVLSSTRSVKKGYKEGNWVNTEIPWYSSIL
jgi:hypothetical protein